MIAMHCSERIELDEIREGFVQVHYARQLYWCGYVFRIISYY